MTYTVVTRNRNSWTRTATGDRHEITWQCGHHHRTLTGAVQCLDQHGDHLCALHAEIETVADDQHCEGRTVDSNRVHTAREYLERKAWESPERLAAMRRFCEGQ